MKGVPSRIEAERDFIGRKRADEGEGEGEIRGEGEGGSEIRDEGEGKEKGKVKTIVKLRAAT